MIDPAPPVRQPVELSREQRDAVEHILEGIDDGRDVRTLGGPAGSGKTTIIRELSARLPKFAVVAPTGRAASVLRRKGIRASTIHSLIYKPIPACRGQCWEDEIDCTCRIIGWERRTSLACDGIICDEASMVNREVYNGLLSFGLQYVFVGDHYQLPPIQSSWEKEQGLPLFNLMESPEYRLEHIHRNAGPIARFCEYLRAGRPANRYRSDTGDVVITDEDDLDFLPVMEAHQVICARNKTRVALNRYARTRLGRNALVEPGEKVMCLKNDRETPLCNGTLATVTAVYPRDHTFDLDSEEGEFSGIQYDPDRFGREKDDGFRMGGPLPFDYGYASTCHKSQGGEWPIVFVYEEQIGHPGQHKRWTYTAASRAQGMLVWKADRPVCRPVSVPAGPWVRRATNSPEGGDL